MEKQPEQMVFTNAEVAEKWQPTEPQDRRIEDPQTGFHGNFSEITPKVAESLMKQGFYLIAEKQPAKAAPASDTKKTGIS